MVSLNVVVLIVVCSVVVSAQSDSCESEKDFVELLHEVIETKINNSLRDDVELLVKAEVNRVVSGRIEKRIEDKVDEIIVNELEGRIENHVETALASEPGEQAVITSKWGVATLNLDNGVHSKVHTYYW